MGRKSSIDLLPEAVRDDLVSWLEDPALDIDTAHERVNALLGELGLQHLQVSRAAVGRKAASHRAEIERIGAEMREAKASREAFYQQFGNDLADGGKFLAETMQAIIFKLNLAMHRFGDFDPYSVYEHSKTVKNLTGSIVQIEEALTKYTKREADIKRSALEEAAKEVEKTAIARGYNVDEARFWREKVLMGGGA